ncbi:hypothetical protein [Paenibacillus sp. FSL R7-0179]|uniref:hypothetical protein n=1 Tax=Paenibacillus sp. FSL R7-0179 TaxID=2921672 RepID=UPI0030FBA557
MSKNSSKSKVRTIKMFGLVGLVIGVVLFILSVSGVNIPVVINTTSFEGMSSALILLFGFPIVLLIIGSIVTIFTKSSSYR